jgi:hypothetical protein
MVDKWMSGCELLIWLRRDKDLFSQRTDGDGALYVGDGFRLIHLRMCDSYANQTDVAFERVLL